ncbi:MAG: AMP-binding protein [Desulfobacterales bacterium]|nr:AMP-binding protein [Desulfobacterales bacterium]
MKKIDLNGQKFDTVETLDALIERFSQRFGTMSAVKTKSGEKVTDKNYAQLYRDIRTTVRSLRENFTQCTHIAIIGELNHNWIVMYLGIVCAGHVAVLIEKNPNVKSVKTLLEKADAELLFFSNLTDKKQLEQQQRAFPAQKVMGTNDLKKLISGGKKGCDTAEIDPDQAATIVFTSGTTGESKGVILTHRNICHNIICCAYFVSGWVKEGDSIIPVLPPHHMFQITTGLLTPLYIGMTICIGDGLKYIFSNIMLFMPSIMVIVPMIAENIYQRIWLEAKKSGRGNRLRFCIKCSRLLLKIGIDIRKKLFASVLAAFGGELRTLICGGAHLRPELVQGFEDLGILLINGYGITECSPVVACNMRANKKEGTVGPPAPAPYCEVKIVEDEILVRGSIIMKGYYKDNEATIGAFDGEWFKTGDLGCFDGKGRLKINGRKKNLIILGDGNNISSEELENQIKQFPGVQDVVVYAKEHKNTHVLTAAIYPEKEIINEADKEQFRDEIQKEIDAFNTICPMYKQIHIVEIETNGFEKTVLGKVKRYQYIEKNA